MVKGPRLRAVQSLQRGSLTSGCQQVYTEPWCSPHLTTSPLPRSHTGLFTLRKAQDLRWWMEPSGIDYGPQKWSFITAALFELQQSWYQRAKYIYLFWSPGRPWCAYHQGEGRRGACNLSIQTGISAVCFNTLYGLSSPPPETPLGALTHHGRVPDLMKLSGCFHAGNTWWRDPTRPAEHPHWVYSRPRNVRNYSRGTKAVECCCLKLITCHKVDYWSCFATSLWGIT